METGRTKPCVFLCEGNGNDPFQEYVVKTKVGLDNGVTGLLAELLGSQLAIFLGLPTPEPAIINIDPIIAESIPDSELSDVIVRSAGLNFGSLFMSGGYTTWPNGKKVPLNHKELAAEIFAFDAMTQNTDRRDDKPNVLWKGSELLLIDHELSFSFIYAILNPTTAYEISSLQFLQKHIFYHSLKGTEVHLDRFAGALESLSDEVLTKMFNAIPDEWKTEHFKKIKHHILEVSKNSDKFINEVQRFLR